MTMQPNFPGQDASESIVFDAPQNAEPASAATLGSPSFGALLCEAREARGLEIEACAHALRLPVRMLRRLERDDYQDIDSKVYLAGYIGKYGHYLGMDPALIQTELDRIKQTEPTLVATGGISHSRFLLDRYATAATYVVLTAVIVVPMVWMGVRGTLNRDLSHLAPLDATPVAQVDAPESAVNDAARLPSHVALPPPVQEQPLLASMAAFPNLDSSAASKKPSVLAPPAAVETGVGGHNLELNLTSASWVEVTDAAGVRLEYGLLPAGSHKIYQSDKPLDVRIGNVSGASATIDGQPVGLDDFRHANVAHFSVEIRDGKATPTAL
ncbi:helix-turn-helix domain-containing protein [Rhodanobacter sp. Root627]|uniref:helix-turn-helix domain-containing protein n=1 Tax=Rhodanobacter sp. Root627 TaxID=1736572 RepID=UPI000A92F251|nr:helix-turn-helix domain-containing protein [Rhodanobacter sp. Root627]